MKYTYLIGWSKLGKFYYGARYAKNCDPNDLLSTYFTSSKIVARYIKKYGLPDIKQIRKTFDTADACRLWEHRVLRRLKIKHKPKWLNTCSSLSVFPPKIRKTGFKQNLSDIERTRRSFNMKCQLNNPKFIKKRDHAIFTYWNSEEGKEKIKKLKITSKVRAQTITRTKEWNDNVAKAKMKKCTDGSKVYNSINELAVAYGLKHSRSET